MLSVEYLFGNSDCGADLLVKFRDEWLNLHWPIGWDVPVVARSATEMTFTIRVLTARYKIYRLLNS